MKIIEMLADFMQDEQAWEMFITGPAGTGKTTSLAEVVEWCNDNNIPNVVCAFTHKACDVLRTKLSKQADIRTLHSFLKVKPCINEEADHKAKLQYTRQFGEPKPVKLLIVDEFSMICDNDYARIGELQDPDYTGLPQMKVLYIGDLNQLPPVNGPQVIIPKKPYWIHLTEVHRQEEGNELIDVLVELNKMITGEVKPHYIEGNSNFIREADIIEAYKSEIDSVILCYTNEKVQEYNFALKGRIPIQFETHFSPTLHCYLDYEEEIDGCPSYINTFNSTVPLGSKYKTLEHLYDSLMKEFEQIKIGQWWDKEERVSKIVPYVFGHFNYKILREYLSNQATKINEKIKKEFKCNIVSQWAKDNPHHPLARKRAKAWRDFLVFDECVQCIDHSVAMTVHKSQGSTFSSVCVDGEDIAKCSSLDLRLRLLYVAISRARYRVYINN